MPRASLILRLQIVSVVAFYMLAALVMVFINKAVLTSSPSVPLLFLFIQLALAVFLLHIAALVSDAVQIPSLDFEKLRQLAPLIVVYAIGLIFNTLCLRDVDASFFQIARGLVLPLTIIVSSLYSRITPHRDILISALIVTAGFVMGVAHSTTRALPAAILLSPSSLPAPSPISLLYGFLASLTIAFHAVLIKASLPITNNSALQLAYWTNAGSLIILLPLVALTGEPWRFVELVESSAWNWRVFATGSLITGVFGFLLCIASLLSVKVTSPVTHMFSSAGRSVLQTLLGVWLFNDLLSFNRVLSIFTITVGTLCYTWLRSNELPRGSPRVVAVGDLEKITDEEDYEGSEEDEVMIMDLEKTRRQSFEETWY